MVTELDTEFLELAYELLEEFGKTVNVKNFTARIYDPTTRKTVNVPNSPINISVKIIPPEMMKVFKESDTLRHGDVKTGIAAKDLTFVVEKGIILDIDSEDWKVMRVFPIYSGDNVALYMLQLRV